MFIGSRRSQCGPENWKRLNRSKRRKRSWNRQVKTPREQILQKGKSFFVSFACLCASFGWLEAGRGGNSRMAKSMGRTQ